MSVCVNTLGGAPGDQTSYSKTKRLVIPGPASLYLAGRGHCVPRGIGAATN
jgi:hypothetical protein